MAGLKWSECSRNSLSTKSLNNYVNVLQDTEIIKKKVFKTFYCFKLKKKHTYPFESPASGSIGGKLEKYIIMIRIKVCIHI